MPRCKLLIYNLCEVNEPVAHQHDWHMAFQSMLCTFSVLSQRQGATQVLRDDIKEALELFKIALRSAEVPLPKQPEHP